MNSARAQKVLRLYQVDELPTTGWLVNIDDQGLGQYLVPGIAKQRNRMSLTNSLVPAKAEANQSKRSADGLDPRLRGDDHIGDPSAMRVRFADTAATFTMTSVLDIREEHARILRDVLQKLLPPHARAYVFGSRAHGGARRYSDLDLALEWSGPLGLDRLGAIAEALSESDIPYKVDIVDLATVDPSFRARIAEGCIPFETADTGG